MQIQPYLFFDGRCEEAIGFYRRTLGAEVQMMMRWKDCPDPSVRRDGNDEKVMHANMRIGDTAVLVSDGECGGHANFQGFALSITAANEAEADRLFGALADGGQVQMPLAKTFFAPKFGMLADRFGVKWMIIVSA